MQGCWLLHGNVHMALMNSWPGISSKSPTIDYWILQTRVGYYIEAVSRALESFASSLSNFAIYFYVLLKPLLFCNWWLSRLNVLPRALTDNSRQWFHGYGLKSTTITLENKKVNGLSFLGSSWGSMKFSGREQETDWAQGFRQSNYTLAEFCYLENEEVVHFSFQKTSGKRSFIKQFDT